MITMRLLVLIVFLSGVLAIGNSGGPVEGSLVTEPSAVQDGVEDDSEEKNTPIAEKGMFINASQTSVKNLSDTSRKEYSTQDVEDSAVPNLPDAELKIPLSTVEKEKALKEDRKYLPTQDGEKVEEMQPSLTMVEGVKPMTYEVSPSSQNEEMKLPNQEKEEKTRVKTLTKEPWLKDSSIQKWEEEKQLTLDEEKVSEPDSEQSFSDVAEEVPLDEVESLTKNAEGVKKPLLLDDEEAKTLFEALWEDVNEEADASNFSEESEGGQPNATSVPLNEDDLVKASIPQMGDNETLQDDSYTVFVFEKDDDDEDAVSQSHEEYGNANTWVIFEEDEDDEDTTSESWIEPGEMTWLAFDDEDNSNESMMRNSSVLISQRQDDGDKDGVLVRLEPGDDDDATPESQEGFDEILYQDRNNGIKTGYDFSDQKNRNSQKEETLSRHFYAYLVATAIIIIILYAVYHNNGKIIAFVMEKKSKGGWRTSDANYQFLDNKV
ncbi:hypothetical protein NDU88_004738 [Pleurodeles waltl]|uniref:Uncharacterized protein n=1 Tax=Pleurodeles waltl TaxID=8319 RepID=A0AAV7LJ22_PLEWA|nr:hypothetical protein NDU88_004738 [Pleurodeles waltl]